MKEYKIDLSGYEGKVREVVSEAVQRHAFELGYEGWSVGGKELKHSDEPYLFIHPSRIGMTTYGSRDYFIKDKGALISAADFLALTPEDIQDKPKEPDFKPFDRVLARDDIEDEWHIDFFEKYDDEQDPYGNICLLSHWRYCIPYEGNERLLGTTEATK